LNRLGSESDWVGDHQGLPKRRATLSGPITGMKGSFDVSTPIPYINLGFLTPIRL
jgi:hypothetical protein